MAEYRYFIHYDSNGKVVGYDMASNLVDAKDFNIPDINTVEVDKEEFKQLTFDYRKTINTGE